ncbi:MAG TPA: cytochrome c3 family protein [Terriglobales bacterium]|nr:cytochrome c3 family protein [Terriglobales bacterium]
MWKHWTASTFLSKVPASVLGFGIFFLLGVVTFRAETFRPRVQPIAFNHAKHIENGLSCSDCHAGVEGQAHAGLPDADVCLTCHEEALGQSSEEEKLRTLVHAGKPLSWAQLTRVKSDIYFSHRRHVQIARLACSECHGPIEKTTAPPVRPFRVFTMETCIRCHQTNRAGTECNDCHR